jgi:hypothetical protein
MMVKINPHHLDGTSGQSARRSARRPISHQETTGEDVARRYLQSEAGNNDEDDRVA